MNSQEYAAQQYEEEHIFYIRKRNDNLTLLRCDNRSRMLMTEMMETLQRYLVDILTSSQHI